MADAWVHSVFCLIAFGKPYFSLNKEIDDWGEQLGPGHRMMGHDYYHAYGKLWDLENPFPPLVQEHMVGTRRRYGDQEAENEAVHLSHSYIDKVWDSLTREDRADVALACAHFAFSPELLRDSAGVDVIGGRVKFQQDNGEVVWDDDPQLQEAYKRLARYIKVVLRNQARSKKARER